MSVNEGCWEISWWFIIPLNIADKPPLFWNKFFSDISERNNDYPDTIYFRRGWVGGGGGGHIFHFGSPWLQIRNVNTYICIRSYDTGRSFEPIFMKFTWLVRVHSWVNPIIFRNNRLNKTTDMMENVLPN